MDRDKLSLATLQNGAAIERFDLLLEQVVANIQDINMPAKKERSITLKLTIKPNDERKMGRISVDINAKMASLSPFGQDIFMGFDEAGNAVAVEANANQMELFPNKKKGGVHVLNGGEKS